MLGPQPSFVDRSGVEDAALLLTRSSERGLASEYLFWNRSVDAVYLLPDAEPPDAFAVTRLTIAARRDAPRRRRAGDPAAPRRRVQRHAPVPQLARRSRPRRPTGSCARTGPSVWRSTRPGATRTGGWVSSARSSSGRRTSRRPCGHARLQVTAPGRIRAARHLPSRQDGAAEEIVVADRRHPRASRSPCARRARGSVEFTAPSTGSVGGRYVSVMASEPTYRPDPSACRRS